MSETKARPVLTTGWIVDGPGGGSRIEKAERPSQQLAEDPFGYRDGAEAGLQRPLYDLDLLAQQWTEGNSLHGRCVRQKASDVLGRGITLRSRDGVEAPSAEEQDRYGEFVRAVEDDDRGEGSLKERLTWAAEDYEGVGWGTLEMSRRRDGVIDGMWYIPGHTVRAHVDGRRFAQSRGGKSVWFKRFGIEGTVARESGAWSDRTVNEDFAGNELLVIRNHTPRSSFYGAPDHIPAMAAMAGWRAQALFNLRFFDNVAVPSYAVIIEGAELSPELESTILEYFAKIKGQPSATLIIPVPGVIGDESSAPKVRFERLTVDVKDATHRLYKQDNALELCIAHGMPPYRVGWPIVGPVSRDTEVMTPDGWRPVAEVGVGEQACTLNLDSGHLEFQPVQQTHRYRYERMVKMADGSGRFQVLVSPDHRMWAQRVTSVRKQKFRWLRAHEMLEAAQRAKGVRYDLPVAGVLRGTTDWTPDRAALVGWLASEGALRHRRGQGYEVCLFQRPGPKADEIASLLARLGISYSTTEMLSSGKGHYPQGSPRHPGRPLTVFRILAPSKRDVYDLMNGRKRIPVSLFQASDEARWACIDALVKGDGHYVIGGGGFHYYSADRGLASDVQTLCVLSGRGARLTERPDRPGQYVVIAKNGRTSPRRRVSVFQEVDYHDDAFCLTVPNGTLLYRYAGCTYIAGNSLGGSTAVEMTQIYLDSIVQGRQETWERRLDRAWLGPKGLAIADWQLKAATLDTRDELRDLQMAELRYKLGMATPNDLIRILGGEDRAEGTGGDDYIAVPLAPGAATSQAPAFGAGGLRLLPPLDEVAKSYWLDEVRELTGLRQQIAKVMRDPIETDAERPPVYVEIHPPSVTVQAPPPAEINFGKGAIEVLSPITVNPPPANVEPPRPVRKRVERDGQGRISAVTEEVA